MNPAAPLILLVDVPGPAARAVADELAATAGTAGPAETVEISAADVLAYTAGTPGGRRPTVVVLGGRVTEAVGLVHSLRPHSTDLAVVVTVTPATSVKLATLPILFPADIVRRVLEERAAYLPAVVSDLLRRLLDRRSHAVAQAAAQRQLSTGAAIDRQLGERLLGQFLDQAPIGTLMLDGDAVIAWNRRAADTLELTEPEALHRPLTDLFPAAERTALRQHLTAHGPGRAAEPDAVFERVRPDGTSQALRIAAQQVTDTEGRSRTLVLAEDVTDRLHAQRKLAERTSHAQLTAEIAAAMTASGALNERLHRCVRAATERLGADRVCIWTLDAQGELAHTVCADGDDAPAGDSPCLSGQRHLVEQVITARRPHLDVAALPGEGRGHGSFVGYPLISGEELIGALTLTTRLALPGSTLVTLENLADQIAVGTRQHRLLDRLKETTRALERPLLPPRLPDLPGFGLAARYAPYGEGLHIGGDFYDAFTAPDGRHVLVMGDVCGKGPAAAAITGLVRHTLWTAAQHASDPEHVLRLVNSALCREGAPFCTLIYVVLDPSPAPARLRIACAGHPAPLLRRADGSAVPLEVHGQLLGVVDAPRHPVTELDLRPGDTLVLYTDGFTEGAGARDQREPEDLAALVASFPPADPARPAESLVTALLDDARDWWGERLRDDLAVLAVTAHSAPSVQPGGPAT
ncbi:SpoIIE family protein phosphatase [Streptomyces sp. TRM 70351]|uniref:SpoIIE family protein phosphatase n=1 Tax=Streptomyces sp. TRM 70351 TaxID=3116552 RepID=UPI002E7AF001|nr:SpoIIE family protein phosphatase [Streptomyces sp. TRM 70351]MEE1930779.1 SpoIIE family protein phosphatase [Streptomyces sp. TRM 70351]